MKIQVQESLKFSKNCILLANTCCIHQNRQIHVHTCSDKLMTSYRFLIHSKHLESMLSKKDIGSHVVTINDPKEQHFLYLLSTGYILQIYKGNNE